MSVRLMYTDTFQGELVVELHVAYSGRFNEAFSEYCSIIKLFVFSGRVLLTNRIPFQAKGFMVMDHSYSSSS